RFYFHFLPLYPTNGPVARRCRSLGRCSLLHPLDDAVETSCQYLGQVVPGFIDPVVGDPVLEIVIRPDLLRAISGADLRLALRRMLFRLLFLMELLELCREDLHGFFAVSELATLRRGTHLEAGRAVDEPHGGLHLVHVLSAGSSASREFHVDVRRIDRELRLRTDG